MVRNISYGERICESFYANDLDEALSALSKIKAFGEWRFDKSNIQLSDIKNIREKSSTPLIFTCRKNNISNNAQQQAYLEAINSHFDYIDLDINADALLLKQIYPLILSSKSQLILSYHNFSKTPSARELHQIFSPFTKYQIDILKVACLAHSEEDMNRLIEFQETSDNIICLGMGKLALQSRALSLIKQVKFTYTALQVEKTTAPGQPDYHSLLSEYEKLASSQNIRLAVIGHPIAHSKSPEIFRGFFKNDQLNGVYEKLDLSEIKDFETIKDKYQGFNVTAPFKEEIIPYLHNISPAAKKIGAVNTIIRVNNKYYGDNTDYFGIISAIEQHSPNSFNTIKKCLIIGAGGAARAAIYAMNLKNISTSVVNRTEEKAIKLSREFNIQALSKDEIVMSDFQLIINTIHQAFDLINPKYLTKKHLVLDAIYPQSQFEPLLKNKSLFRLIKGEKWLYEQARKAYYLFRQQKLHTSISVNKK